MIVHNPLTNNVPKVKFNNFTNNNFFFKNTEINQINFKSKQLSLNNNSHLRNHEVVIVHWNCNGLSGKIEELKLFLKLESPDIISLNEIKCNQALANLNFNALNYNSCYKIRDNSIGGGVALLVKSSINFEELDLMNEFNCEIVGIKIKTVNKTELSIFSYYNSPTNVLNSDFFYKLESNNLNYLVCGDFNSKSTHLGCLTDNSNGNVLTEIIINSSGQLLNDTLEPTFTIRNRNYAELLDRFFGSPLFAVKMSEYEVLNDSVLDSDHYPIKAVFNFDKPFINNSKSKAKFNFNYNKANWTNLSKEFNLIKFSECTGSNST